MLTTQSVPTLRHPFGEVCCEDEVRILGDHYKEFFFDRAPFSDEALEDDRYLIVGRRGSGKSSLAQFFTFQRKFPNARCVDVREPQEYEHVLTQVAQFATGSPQIAISRLVQIWEQVIWIQVFRELQEFHPVLAAVPNIVRPTERSSTTLVLSFLKALLRKFVDGSGEISDGIAEWVSTRAFREAQHAAKALLHKHPVIVAFDTLERYDTSDDAMMRATAALVEAASKFNVEWASRGLHVKVFLSAEVFPHLRESTVSNTLKFIRNPVYMGWRPKDLLRLLCWRYYRYLERVVPESVADLRNLDWSNHQEVMGQFWTKYFGQSVPQPGRTMERTLPFLLRHTQMRPRQLIMLCNAIARQATRSSAFPCFSSNSLIEAIRHSEADLAAEVFNSYECIYRRASRIAEALTGLPMRFKGNQLDKRAKLTSREWVPDEYSLTSFTRFVTELGIVGRVRKVDSRTGIIAADFEYAMSDRLAIQSDDECVIHPMFYRKLNVRVDPSYVVYPFRDHHDF